MSGIFCNQYKHNFTKVNYCYTGDLSKQETVQRPKEFQN